MNQLFQTLVFIKIFRKEIETISFLQTDPYINNMGIFTLHKK